MKKLITLAIISVAIILFHPAFSITGVPPNCIFYFRTGCVNNSSCYAFKTTKVDPNAKILADDPARAVGVAGLGITEERLDLPRGQTFSKIPLNKPFMLHGSPHILVNRQFICYRGRQSCYWVYTFKK